MKLIILLRIVAARDSWQTTCGMKSCDICVFLVWLFRTEPGALLEIIYCERRLLPKHTHTNHWAYIKSFAWFCSDTSCVVSEKVSLPRWTTDVTRRSLIISCFGWGRFWTVTFGQLLRWAKGFVNPSNHSVFPTGQNCCALINFRGGVRDQSQTLTLLEINCYAQQDLGYPKCMG